MIIRNYSLKNKICLLLLLFVPTILWAGPYDGCIIAADQQSKMIYILDPAKKNLNNGIVWSVSAEELTGVAPGEITEIGGTDIKWVMGGEYILFVCKRPILLRIKDKKVIWYGRNGGGNAHSVELLPDGNIVTANSEGKNIKFFHVEHGVNNKLPVDSVTHPSAHGVVWDAERDFLWGVGGSELRAYRYNYNKKNPGIDSIVHSYPINATGHDLYPVPGKDKLYYTNKDTWVFDIKTGKSTQLTTKGAKSISQNGPGGEIIYTVAVGQTKAKELGINAAQTPYINSIDGEQREFTGAGFYKARWFIPCPFSYPEWDYDAEDVTTDKTTSGVDRFVASPISISPNKLHVSSQGAFSLRLYGVNGQIVKQLEGLNITSFDTNTLSSGVYMVSLYSEAGEFNTKIQID